MSGNRFFSKELLEIDLEKYHSELTSLSTPKFEGNLYHWLLSTKWQVFFISVVLVYLASNWVFALAYWVFSRTTSLAFARFTRPTAGARCLKIALIR